MVATINLANNSQKLPTQRWPRAMRRVNHSYFSFSNVGSYETNQVLTICLMSTKVLQYKTSISINIIIYHSCLLIWCLKPEWELASAQYLRIFILKTKCNTSKILAYSERAQKTDYMKKHSAIQLIPLPRYDSPNLTSRAVFALFSRCPLLLINFKN